MYPQYKEEKATQIAARLLQLHGGRMNYLKLLKLLYFIDRQALSEWGEPLTFDRFVSMQRGMVLTKTYDNIRHGDLVDQGAYWNSYIEKRGYDVSLLQPGEIGELSDAEIELINRVDQTYGQMEPFRLVDICHQLPEYKKTDHAPIPVTYSEVLRATGKSEEDIAEIDQYLKERAYLDALFE